jgi:hypothetical protein
MEIAPKRGRCDCYWTNLVSPPFKYQLRGAYWEKFPHQFDAGKGGFVAVISLMAALSL